MTRRSLPVASRWARAALWAALPLLVLMVCAGQSGSAQAVPYERTYRQSKSAVEKALKELQPSTSGRLPVLEGFAVPGDHPLNRYQRAYYQSAVQVSSTPSGGSLVRVNTKVTAWYADSIPSRSGYQLLTSNGRIEADLLDQLTDLLATSPSATSSGGSSDRSFPASAPPAASAKRPATAEKAIENKGVQEPTISAPMPRSPDTGRTFSSSAEAVVASSDASAVEAPASAGAGFGSRRPPRPRRPRPPRRTANSERGDRWRTSASRSSSVGGCSTLSS